MTSQADDARAERIKRALKDVRERQGTAYAKDLIPILWEDDPAGLSHTEQDVLKELNCWGLQLMVIDETRRTNQPGLAEYATTIEYRPIIDALAYGDETEKYRLHPLDIAVGDVDGTTVEITRRMPARLEKVLSSPEVNGDPQLKAAGDRYKGAMAKPLELPVVDSASLRAHVICGHKHPGPVVIDMSHTYSTDFCIRDVMAGLPKAIVGDAREFGVCVDGDGAILGGKIVDLSGACGDGQDGGHYPIRELNFVRAVFDAETITLANAKGVRPPKDGSARPSLSFKDTSFTPKVAKFTFEGCEFAGFDLSFEDMTITQTHICFDGASLEGCGIYLYQMVADTDVKFTFVDANLGGASLDFSDSTVGTVVFYDVVPFPGANLSFRHCGSLALENCVLGEPIDIAAIDRLSLVGSRITGFVYVRDCVQIEENGECKLVPLTYSEAYRSEPCATPRHPRNRKFWILDALEVNAKRRKELANQNVGAVGQKKVDDALPEEFAALKEVFHAMGEYELEDEAFIRHMRTAEKRGLMKVISPALDKLGGYGTSPGQISRALVIVLVAFWALNLGLLYLLPATAFAGHIGGCRLLEAFLFTWGAFVQGGLPLTAQSALTVGISLFETTVGWFFLGYFFVAFTRKTLR